jgi:hypothetical protein
MWTLDFLDRDELYLGAECQHGSKGHVKDTARFVNSTLVTISRVDIIDYDTGLILWHGAMLMKITHKALSPLASTPTRPSAALLIVLNC